MSDDNFSIERAAFGDLSPHRLYSILRLRAEVFVVEQECAFNDVDGRDTHPDAVHYWIDDPAAPERADGEVLLAAMRLLPHGPQEWKVSRVVCRPERRHSGLAGALLRRALADHPGTTMVLDAQSRLEAWYASFGFVVCGDRFLEDGIEHTPMRRVPG